MTSTAIRTEALTKRYGERRGLDGLDLTVQRGEVFGFLGPNGAGKSTTIRILLDLIRPTSGRAEVLGTDPRRGGPALRSRLGYLPGELAMEGRENVGELLGFFARLRGGVPTARVHELAERLDLDLSRRVRGLSKGNKQKVGLVQALMHRPELLVLDEPTSGLDPLVQQEFLRMVREARDEGQTVLMSSHILSEVEDAADRVGIIREGRLVNLTEVGDLRLRSVDVEITFADAVDAAEFTGLPGLSDVRVDGSTLRCRLDGVADALVKAAARHTVRTLRAERPDLEETFFSYYAKEEQHA